MPVGEDRPDEDPFQDLVLDDAFILGAPMREASAEERTRRPEPRSTTPVHGGRRRRTRRRVRQRLARLLREPWTARRTITAMAAGLLVFVALAIGRDALVDDGPGAATYSYDSFDASTLESNGGSGRPTPSTGADEPLGTPPTVDPDDEWAPIGSTRGRPARWDPCKEIHYVTDERAAPAGAEDVIDDAVAEISAATGLVFVDDGETTEDPSIARPAFQPERYGDVWAPVLISWTDIRTFATDGAAIGAALPVVRRASDGTATIVSGTIVFDVPSLTVALYDVGPEVLTDVALHELAHLVGLDHVDSDGELMYPEAGHRTGLGPGDRAGLAEMGRGPCVTGL